MLTLDKDSMDVGTLKDGINCVISNPSKSSGTYADGKSCPDFRQEQTCD
jgi:hypothetical protein